MRIGQNPEKENKDIKIENYHRIIVPVYIPNFEGYFSNSLDIFKLCIESLLLTVHAKTRITIYNNNSHKLVKEYIDLKYSESKFIDQVFHSKENLGKINAILAASKGNLEPLITITDADVLFKNGWQKAVEKVIVNFPEAGMVSPVPSSKVYKMFTSNNWYYGFFKGNLLFQNVIDAEAMHKFDLSLGNDKLMYKPIHLKKYLVIRNKKNKQEAVMGCGHFVATLKREVFDYGSNKPAFVKIVGGVERIFIDTPNEKLGLLRLATKENYAYHMGNKIENWMYEEFSKLKTHTIDNSYKATDFKFKPVSKIGMLIGKLLLKIISRSSLLEIKLLNYLGLDNKEY
ncbi:glycosyltransferase family 2 protein [Lutibacter sp.]|uniref:glycosyltransferase family 2 protein n=1 Tax=Lutibacter sp. TaxID=1925666 RepID=UPI0025C094D1|nr:glycosyltransferase family 2 protein [Lutibacter sp.]MCF6182888.1 glycosyltransferase family 2 protein [Lutibacter sp.]